MLELAEVQLKKYNEFIAIQSGDIFTHAYGKNKYDAVVSSFAVHHARSDLTYQKIYRNIFHTLKKHGIFICADIVEGGSKSLTEYHLEEWRGYLSRFYDKKFIDQLLISVHKEDSPISLYKHLTILKKVNFKHVDVVFKKYNFAVYVGIK
jgi:tRNA (cmo5U34)-methyltransferase